MTIVAFTSQHGGVGITTSAVTIAYALAQEGHKTLLLDLQMQGHCALNLGLESGRGACDWLLGDEPASSHAIIAHDNGLRLLRCDSHIYGVLHHYGSLFEGQAQLVDKIRDAAPDCWVIIDSPRSNQLADAVLAAADIIVIPFRGDLHSWHGALTTVELSKALHSTAEVILLPTLIDHRHKLSRYIMDEAHKYFGDQVALPIVQRIAVAEASSYGKTIWEYKAEGIEDVQAAYSSLMNRLLPKRDSTAQPQESTVYEHQIAELQRQLAEANAWRAHHDVQARMDILESSLSTLVTEVGDTKRLLQQLTVKWERLRHLFSDHSST
jgi:chromosome partitioning protein